MISSGAWRWFGWGVLAIAFGLTVWATTFVLVPAGFVMIVVGFVRWVRWRNP
jgi:hypothetical protein